MTNKKYPLLSVAMATYNGERFIRKQIDSIINQSYKNIELIICDDYSEDATVDIIQEYMSYYPFIKLYRNETRLGFVKNFEKAIDLCIGEYIALSDQDDIWDLEKLTISMEAMFRKEKEFPNLPIMVHSDLSVIDKDKKILCPSYFYFKHYKLKDSKDLGHIAGPCGVMGNTIIFNQKLKNIILPFPEYLEFHDYWIALINELVGKRVTIQKQLVNYTIHEENTSNSKDKIKKQFFSMELFLDFIHCRITPPFLHSNRAYIIDHILERFELNKEDKTLLIHFLYYLKKKSSKILRIYYLFRHSLLKRNIKYKIEVLINILIQK